MNDEIGEGDRERFDYAAFGELWELGKNASCCPFLFWSVSSGHHCLVWNGAGCFCIVRRVRIVGWILIMCVCV